ncbi:two-component sensor histidine kinase [Alicyclobacillus cycloheptanicus]|nr:two-component sensor histidine kinase [Alicyclobacillus cycloheptanicus]
MTGREAFYLDRLNAAVLFISKQLHVTCYNTLACQLIDPSVTPGVPVPLERCISPEREEYHILSQMVAGSREYRDMVIRWEVDGRVRHVLVDSFVQRSDSAADVSGMHVMMKELGNFSALEQQVQRTEKLATIGKMAAGIAHEIRNPLTTVKGFLQMMQSQLKHQERETELAYTQVMMTEIERVNALVSELLLLSKPQQMAPEVCAVAAVIDDILPLIQSEARLHGVAFEYEMDRTVSARMDMDMIQQVVLNLVKNAFEAMDKGGRLHIQVSPFRQWARIDVSDTGPGIPYYQMDKIFDAFFTTKDKGIGLGLPICQKIIDDHGGEIRVSSKGFGTTFTVLLPKAEQGRQVM